MKRRHKRILDYSNKRHKILGLKGRVPVPSTEWKRRHSKMAFAGITTEKFTPCPLGNVDKRSVGISGHVSSASRTGVGMLPTLVVAKF